MIFIFEPWPPIVADKEDSPAPSLRYGCALVLVTILIPDYYP